MPKKSKSSSSSHKKTTSLESVSSELNVLDLAEKLYQDIVNDNSKGAISVLRNDPLLANHVYDLTETGLERGTPLTLACFYGNYNIVRELLNKQYFIDVNFKSVDNLTPLSIVNVNIMNKGQPGYSIIKKLLENGADINNMDNEGYTLFRFVCEVFVQDMIEYLLKHPNLDVNKKLIDGDGPIQAIVGAYFRHGYDVNVLHTIEKILKIKDLKINSRGEGGDTTLHILANEDRKQDPGYSDEKIKKLALLLIENGADPNVKNNRGESSLDNKLIQEVYFEYILSKVKKLQAKQRLSFSKMMIDPKYEDRPSDIIIKILKSLKMPPLDKSTLDKTNKLLIQIFKEELSKEIEQYLKKKFTGQKLDDMVEFYRKKIKDPRLSQQQRKQYRKMKRTRKKHLSLSSRSSDYDTSELELKRVIKMSIDEFNKDTGSKKNKKKKNKTQIKK